MARTLMSEQAYYQGADAAARMYKVADALMRAVQRGAVAPSIENSRALLLNANMSASPRDIRGWQRRVARVAQGAPARDSGDAVNWREMRHGSRVLPVAPNTERLDQISQGGILPRIRELRDQAQRQAAGDRNIPRSALGVDVLQGKSLRAGFRASKDPTKQFKRVTPTMAHALDEDAGDISRLREWHARPGGVISLNTRDDRATLEHEVGEAWLHSQAMRSGKKLTPYASHLGPEATVREWAHATHDPARWAEVRHLRDASHARLDRKFPAMYAQAGGSQGAPIPMDSRQSRAIGRMVDRHHQENLGPKLQRGAALPNADMHDMTMALSKSLEGYPLTRGAQRTALAAGFPAPQRPAGQARREWTLSDRFST